MKRICLFTAALLIVFNLNAQLSVKIFEKNNPQKDSIKICSKDTVTFNSEVMFDGEIVNQDIIYIWDYDHGTTKDTTIFDTITHIFSEQKGHKVLLNVKYNEYTASATIPVLVGLDADFSKVKTDINATPEIICPGEEFTIFGETTSAKWEKHVSFKCLEKEPYMIEKTDTYNNYIAFRDFLDTDKILSAQNIDSIVIKMEHENAGNIEIKITCPSGKELILKDFGGEAVKIGEPKIGDSGDPGLAYIYAWKQVTKNHDMNTESSNYATLPAGTYTPQYSFEVLKECQLNGYWQLTVTDNTDKENGFLFEWEIYFKDIEPQVFQYQNSFNYQTATWSSEEDGVGASDRTTGNVVIESPSLPGTYEYQYTINNDFNCPYEHMVSVVTTKAEFVIEKAGTILTGEKITADLGDKLKFKDTTKWATEYEWDFGDKSLKSSEKEIERYYVNTGTFTVICKATSPKGCFSYDTAYIKINALDTVEMFTKNYIFTPNGDGVNDFFSVFDGKNGDLGYTGGIDIDSLHFTWTNSADKDASNISELSGRIFDRYGNTVCSWKSVEEALYGWDGTVNNNGGQTVADGVYFFIVVVRMKTKNTPKLEPFKGTIYVRKKKN